MKQFYLLDTNVLVDLLRDPIGPVAEMLYMKGLSSCAIADISLYELYCGAYASRDVANNTALIKTINEQFNILPTSDAYEEAAIRKVALKKAGDVIEDIDILIACTALQSGRVLVTGNARHMTRIEGLVCEDWNRELK